MSRLLRGVLWAAIIVAAANLILPFVGPLFGFGMGSDPAFTFTTGRFVRHVLPDGIVIIGAAVILMSRDRVTKLVAGIAAVIAGGWVGVGPHVLAVDSASQFWRRITYHSATGVVLAGLAGVAVGLMLAGRTKEQPVDAMSPEEREKLGV